MDPQYQKQAACELSAADAKMAELIERAGPPRLSVGGLASPYQAVFRSIIYQQLHGKAAETILNRVLALYPTARGPAPHGGRYPKPAELAATDDALLRAAGLSRNKLAALKDLSVRAVAGQIPTQSAIQKLGDEEIISLLSEVRGVGRWTAEMLLIFHLGRRDILPVTDFGVRAGFQLTYKKREMPTPALLARHGARWAPHRSLAAWYLWRAVDLSRLP